MSSTLKTQGNLHLIFQDILHSNNGRVLLVKRCFSSDYGKFVKKKQDISKRVIPMAIGYPLRPQ